MGPTLLVLAAGMGSRYGGLKQVDPVGPSGEILLEYSVYDALRAGFGQMVCVIHRDLEEAFRQSVGHRLEGRLPVRYAYQELNALPEGFSLPEGRTKPWGTGHAILCARDAVGEAPMVAINADDYYGPTAFRLMCEHLATSATDYAMVGFHLRNTLSEHGSVSRGLCRCDSDGWLQSVVEHTKIFAQGRGAISQPEEIALDGSEIVSMNFWGFQGAMFAELELQFRDFLAAHSQESKSEFYIPSVVDRLIREGRGRVKVLPSTDSWFGVTYPQDKPVVVARIRELVARGLYPDPLWGEA